MLLPSVATVLTACGIETSLKITINIQRNASVATVLTACGIETIVPVAWLINGDALCVATVLTACGIETPHQLNLDQKELACCNSTYRLRY